MSSIFGLSVNNDALVEYALQPFADQIDLKTAEAESWGLAYYNKGELLQRVEPRSKGEKLDVMKILGGLRAEIVVMHTRSSTVSPTRRENIHPFRFKEWMFAQNGTLAGFEKYRDHVIDAMPPFLQRGIRGDTDSEHLFYLMLSFVYDSGLFGRAELDVHHIRDALVRAFSMVRQLAVEHGEEIADTSAVVSDGYSLVAASMGIPVDFALVEGIPEQIETRDSGKFGRFGATRQDAEGLRAVLVISGRRQTPTQGFSRLDPSSVIMVTKNHGVQFSRIEG